MLFNYTTRRVSALAIASSLFVATWASAADHGEAPGTQADPAADITDFYAWPKMADSSEGTLVAAIGFGTGLSASKPVPYDPDVLYGIHIDSDMDHIADTDIWIRFGQNSAGEWGVQVQGLPGTDAAVVGAVESTLETDSGLRVFAGLRDDPFFFDFTGFSDTLATGNLSFDSTRDSFAGVNIGAIVVEMDAATAAPSGQLQIWATTARMGGAQ